MADRLRPALRFRAIAFVLYLMLAFILMSTYEFVRYGVFPAALVIIALGLVYGVRRRARRSARPSNVRLLVDAPPDPIPRASSRRGWISTGRPPPGSVHDALARPAARHAVLHVREPGSR
ncbi:MAG: hypothetical protein ACP5HT_05520 [Conexivisphaera sp.]